jgi:hypothetical protein
LIAGGEAVAPAHGKHHAGQGHCQHRSTCGSIHVLILLLQAAPFECAPGINCCWLRAGESQPGRRNCTAISAQIDQSPAELLTLPSLLLWGLRRHVLGRPTIASLKSCCCRPKTNHTRPCPPVNSSRACRASPRRKVLLARLDLGRHQSDVIHTRRSADIDNLRNG